MCTYIYVCASLCVCMYIPKTDLIASFHSTNAGRFMVQSEAITRIYDFTSVPSNNVDTNTPPHLRVQLLDFIGYCWVEKKNKTLAGQPCGTKSLHT